MKLYLLAGEASGDMHGRNMVTALKKRLPGVELRGMGGDGLSAEGMSLIRHINDTNFMGFVEVVQNWRTIRGMFRDVKADMLAWKPDALVVIDYPGFNLRIAEFAHAHHIPVIYYISPQVWAWKKGRVKKLRRFVERVLTILPFEKPFLEKHGVTADFVGHPLLDEIRRRPVKSDSLRKQLSPGGKPIITLFPGSRRMELERIFPVMLEMPERFPAYQFVIAGATTQPESYYRELVGGRNLPVVMGRTYDLLSISQSALVKSGTATLETALFRVPQVVCYAANGVSVWLAKRLANVKYISLPNLIMDSPLVTELIQQDLTADKLEQELKAILPGAERRSKMLLGYDALHALLGEGGASEEAARIVAELLTRVQKS